MRKIIKLSFFSAILLVLYACPDMGKDEVCRALYLKNTTNHDIKLKFFLKSTKEVTNERILNKNELIYLASDCQESFNDVNNPNTFHVDDSVRIIFNNKKFIVQTFDKETKEFSNPIDRNLLKISNYNINKSDYTFFITDEDYNNAIDCEGNCE